MTTVSLERDRNRVSGIGVNPLPVSPGRRRTPQRRGVVARPVVPGRPEGVGAPRVGGSWTDAAALRPHGCSVSRPGRVSRGAASTPVVRRHGVATGQLRLTDRGIAVILLIAAALTVAALTCIAVTAVEVTSAPARVQTR